MRAPLRPEDERPLVSLVMPAWRPQREWLREAVASCLAQRDCAIELIVVDNGNPTPVADMLADVVDARLRFVRIPHGGVSRARNVGVAEARGTHLRFIDCDDVVDQGSTRRLLDLSIDDLTVAYGATEYCDVTLTPYKTVTCTLEGVIPAEALTEFTVTLPSLLFPRRAVDLAGSWDEDMTICEDWDFVQRVLEHARVRGETRVASRYRRHATSAVGTATIDLADRSAARVIDKYVERHPEQRRSPHVRRAHAIRLVSAGDRYLRIGDRRSAFTRFVAAGRMDAAYTARAVSGIIARELRSRLTRGRPRPQPPVNA